jgi:hypothetical protein
MAKKAARGDDRGSLSGQLREILASRGDSIYAMEMDAGIPRGGLARFMSGERALTTETLDRLAKSLGLRLVEVERRKGNRRPRVAPAL